MELLFRWLPAVSAVGSLALLLGNALRLRRALGRSPIVIWKRGGPGERASIVVTGLGLMLLVLSSVAPRLLAWLPAMRVPEAVRVMGCVVVVAAVLLAFESLRVIGESWRVGIDDDPGIGLVTTGPYRFVRHPIYASMLGWLVGLVLVQPGVFLVVILLGGWWLLRAQASREERFLRERFGAAYADYARGVGRFVPGVGRLPFAEDPSTQREIR